jgi:MFS family permease
MREMSLFAEVVDGNWQPGIGDPTVLGWLTVAAYLFAAVACGWAAWREPSIRGGRRTKPVAFWLVLAILLTLLGINKQLDLQSLLTVVARRLLSNQGLYEKRRTYQVAFIGCVALVSLGSLIAFLWFSRHELRSRWLALVGMVFILGFVVIRAASFHHVDALLASELGGLKWNWIFEIGGILVVGVAASRAAYRRRRDGAGAPPRGWQARAGR